MHPKIYDAHGLSTDELKKYWTAKKPSEKREKLQDMIRTRINDGIDSGLKDHKIWWAIDLAYDTPFNQLTPTLVRDVISKSSARDSRDILDILKNWNIDLGSIVHKETVDGKEAVYFDVPMFFQIVVPLVKSYVTIRRAKLFNDRNLFPFMKYEPIKFTLLNRLIGEILTDIVQHIAQSYGYPSILRQAILQALQYGTCLMFPMEEWHKDEQIVMKDGKEESMNLKEGIRYQLPHPTRFFWDKNHRISTYNTDSGCEFGGYWKVDRFSSIEDEPHFWNKDSVAINGTDKWYNSYRNYFTEVSPCVMNFPTGRTGAGESDREKEVIRYSSNERDKAVFRTELFMKIRPKFWGMGDYDHPTWMRFVIAGGDTVLWAKPIPYSPIIYFGYDADESRSRNSSMSLEILPFQDHFGILLSQYIYSVRQNLSKAVFYDSDQVDEADVKQVENLGVRRFSNIPFIAFSGRKAKIAGQDKTQAFHNVNFPILDTASIAGAMTTMLSILERVLVLAAQEIGQAATHEQTAEETKLIAANTSTRVTFTGSFIDDGVDAWKRQLYYGSRAYLDEDVTAQVSISIPGAEEALEKLGFDIVDRTGSDDDGRIKAVVDAKMSKLTIDSFIATREGESRINSVAIAGAMSNLIQVAFNNPMTAMAIGPEQALDLLTEIGKLAGMPKEFKLKVVKGGTPEEQAADTQAQLQGMAKEIANQTLEVTKKEVGEPLAEALAETNTAVAQAGEVATETQATLQALMQRLAPIIQAIESVQSQPQLPPPNAIDQPYPPVPEGSLVPA